MNFDLRLATAKPKKIRLMTSLAAVLIVAASAAAAENDAPPSVSNSEVTVQVKIFETKTGQALKDRSGVAVWLVPIDSLQKASFDTQQPRYQMTQHHKMFEPHLLVVPAGSIVEFGNRDPWFHNAFSISNGRQFDLGLYHSGARKSVRFDRAGASYVFCRIHPDMAAVVLAVNSSYFGISDHAGRVSIGKVPPGKYLLHVWYEDAAQAALQALETPIIVVEEKRELPTISVAVTRQPTWWREDQR